MTANVISLAELNGLTDRDLGPVFERYGYGRCEVSRTADGDRYVSVEIDAEREVYHSISRYRSKVVLLDECGRVRAEGKTVEEVLVLA